MTVQLNPKTRASEHLAWGGGRIAAGNFTRANERAGSQGICVYVCVCARAYIHIRTRTHAHTQVVLVGGRAGLECFKEVFIRRKEWNDRGMDVFTWMCLGRAGWMCLGRAG